MSANPSRIELLIDIFDQTSQRAQVLPTITPAEFIRAILQEFAELAYLGDDPANYHLCKLPDHSPLVADSVLGEQVRAGDPLVLQENTALLPTGTARPSRPLYLREPGTGKVFPIQWLPAIIGRKDTSQPDHEQVAVDLAKFPTGARVSRRHALLSEEDGQLSVASLADNPTEIKLANNAEGESLPVTAEKMALAPGQRIHLKRSGIDLLVIVRDDVNSDQEASG
jgi:hypothetical protein